MKITFAGGGGIGASCALLEAGETRILIDCGVRFKGESRLPDLSILSGKHLDAVLVTHAHSDHTGALPVICEAFPRAPVYASPPTMELSMILLRDALRLMDSEREGELPLYAKKQVDQVSNAFVPVHHDHSVEIGDIKVRFLPAAHILGASMLHVETPFGNVLFTGDFSVTTQRTVPALTRPAVHADIVVSEATYGERLHEDRSQAEMRLLDKVRAVLQDGGRVLIPAFAVGRAQEVLLILKNALRSKTLPEVPVFVDGMVRAVCGVYGRHDRYVTRALFHEIRKTAHPFYTNGISPVETPAARQAVLDIGPCIIVASSGMLNGGASAYYAEAMAPNPKDAILITGYQDEESPGRALLNLTDTEGPRSIQLNGRSVVVACRFEKYGLSAHADRLQTAALIEGLRPKTVVLVHGGDGAKQALAASLSVRDILIPADGESVERSFPVRGSARLAASDETAREMAPAALRRVLGPPGDRPVSARVIAETWFGRRVTRQDVDALVAAAVALNLVRRDDRRRDLLHVLSLSETDCFPDEAALEQTLKTENPKGRLLEWAMRTRVEPPTATFGVDGAFHTATLSLLFEDQSMTAGPHRAASKKTAEQLAARELLSRIDGVMAARPQTPKEQPPIPSGRDPMMLLNELRQIGLLQTFDYSLTSTSGPSHQPVFTIVCYAILENGERIESNPVSASAKKEARREAAAGLVERLTAAGITN